MNNLFFSNTEKLVQILITAPLIYFLVIFYIRLVGKRSTSQMNNFDWIVTVAIGSLVGSTIILPDTSILDGGIAILLLLGLQYFLTKIMLTSPLVRKVVRSTPQLLLFEGDFLYENMKKERILKSEITSAIREQGYQSKGQVYAIVLETDASFSVIPYKHNQDQKAFTLADVQGLPDGLKDDLEDKLEKEN